MTKNLRRNAALALVLGLAAATPACGDEVEEAAQRAAKQAQNQELATLSFEGMVYVDEAASNAVIIERVSHQTQSAFLALRRAHVTVSHKKQVEVDLKRLVKESVTVVDPEAPAPRAAFRVRYKWVGSAVVPKALAREGELQLGLLQNDAPAHAAEILAACSDSSAADAQSKGGVPHVFDASRLSCQKAIADEQEAITVARANIGPSEVTRREFERLYLPMIARIKPKAPKSARPPSPGAPAAAQAPTKNEPGSGTKSAQAEPAAASSAVAAPAPAHDKELDDDDDDGDDDALAPKLAPGKGVGGPGHEAPAIGGGEREAPTYAWAEPNYYLLVFTAIALFALLRRRKQDK